MATLAAQPTAGNVRAGDATTLASIVAFPGGTPRPAASLHLQIENITQFTYSYDVLQIADPFTVVVPDPRGSFRDKLLPGWTIEYSMANPEVAQGARTLKISGLIVDRQVTSDERGTAIRLTGADIGWHLTHNDAPLWFNLRGPGVSLEELAKACVHPEKIFRRDKALDTNPGWGFSEEIATDNIRNSEIKRNIRFTAIEEAGFKRTQSEGGVVWVQVQPGQKMAELLISYARRQGMLVGVTVDRKLQFFLPSYKQSPSYAINYSADRKRSADNNVLRASRQDRLDSLYTHVTVVGERPVFHLVGDQGVSRFNKQFTKLYGRAFPADWPSEIPQLPFRRRATISDGEIVRAPERRARWYQKRGLFDAQVLSYALRGHHQQGRWWEADTMCKVNDEVLGVSGNYYVSAVRCQRDMQSGDTTTVTLRRPNLLTEIPLEP